MFEISSPAKINLKLKIIGKRHDGFHEIETIMQEISLKDVLTISKSNGQYQLNCEGIPIPGNPKDNLINKATDLFLDKTKSTKLKNTIQIKLIKNIPCGSGLGGGSSNAVATLKGLNVFFDSPLNREELYDLAIKLGSDTAFFLFGGQCICTGRGENIKEINNQNKTQNIILILPKIHVPTEKIFKAYEFSPSDKNNHLEEISLKLFPEIYEIKDQVSQIIQNEIFMSGSGSTLFTLIDEIKTEELNLLNKIANCTIIKSHFNYQGCHVS
ncbi:MAG: 4-(cytidine 5'-diphospho)-2-C-methyl-D-erythritol kinase [Planctomycetota bacterium]|nr:MAG: 4-(cytidine 5'-diphospho)-2-C-methyl-D-erythritol kinase [Planctomycetota bacterium]